MDSISISYTCKYEVSFAPNYKFSKCGKCFNFKSGRQIKKVYNSGCIGYSIQGRFYSLTFLRSKLVKIKTNILPF